MGINMSFNTELRLSVLFWKCVLKPNDVVADRGNTLNHIHSGQPDRVEETKEVKQRQQGAVTPPLMLKETNTALKRSRHWQRLESSNKFGFIIQLFFQVFFSKAFSFVLKQFYTFLLTARFWNLAQSITVSYLNQNVCPSHLFLLIFFFFYLAKDKKD